MLPRRYPRRQVRAQIQSQDNLHHQADTIFRKIFSYERNAGKQEHLSRENKVEVIVKLP